MKPSPTLIKLVDKCLDQSISRTEMAQLEDLLEDNHALQYYLEMTAVEGALPLALDQAPAVSAPQKNVGRWLRPLAIAAAVTLVFAAGHTVGKRSVDAPVQASIESRTESHSATITSLIGVDWSDAAPKSLSLTSDSAPISLNSGLMELTFASGVRTLVEGPAQLVITGDNQAYLSRGKMVADVPKGAEGFTITHSLGKVVDLGTEFAINIPDDNSKVEVGVFSGEVELYDESQDSPVKIFENHAMAHINDLETPFESIPFQRADFVRHLPSREFPWKLDEIATSDIQELEFDVSHLVWRSGDYRAVVKWMRGKDAVVIHGAELLLDGQVIGSDSHISRSGFVWRTKDNTYNFSIPPELHRKGQWTLRLQAIADNRDELAVGNFTQDSSGILLFEEGQALRAEEHDFIGTWEYHHDNKTHKRVFHADGSAEYYFNGKLTRLFENSRWDVKDGILTLSIPPSSDPHSHAFAIVEHHILRDNEELIFIDRPYRNAKKVE